MDFREADVLPLQRLHLFLQVITHEVELVCVVFFCRVEGCFRAGHGEYQPSMTGIDCGEPENIAEESAIRIRILAVNDYVGARDHRPSRETHLSLGLAVTGTS